MLKVGLVALITISFISTSVFAEPSIDVRVSSDNIKSLDSVLVSGTISGVSQFKPVKLTVMDPDEVIVYSPLLEIKDGKFKKLLHHTLPSFKSGTYIVTASHADTEATAQTQFTVTAQSLPRNQIVQPIQEPTTDKSENVAQKSGLQISADTINGSDTINIVGSTDMFGIDLTLIVNSPNGNVISIAQVTPDSLGNFEMQIKTGGQMWKEDGMYKITVNQSGLLQYEESINVEIKDGVVVPEFGVVASLILVISIISIIIVSSKSKLSILPRY